jgi:hypothetical protein
MPRPGDDEDEPWFCTHPECRGPPPPKRTKPETQAASAAAAAVNSQSPPAGAAAPEPAAVAPPPLEEGVCAFCNQGGPCLACRDCAKVGLWLSRSHISMALSFQGHERRPWSLLISLPIHGAPHYRRRFTCSARSWTKQHTTACQVHGGVRYAQPLLPRRRRSRPGRQRLPIRPASFAPTSTVSPGAVRLATRSADRCVGRQSPCPGPRFR